MLVEDQKLIEKHAKPAGLDVKVGWTKFAGGNVMNDALLSNSLQFAFGGVGPLVTAKDRIALPAVEVSIQAVTPEMAAEKAFGEGQQSRLDPLTVSMPHADAQTALPSGASEHNAHFSSPPFQYQQLEQPDSWKDLFFPNVHGLSGS